MASSPSTPRRPRPVTRSRRTRPWWVAPVAFLAGTSLVAGAGLLAWDRPSLAPTVIVASAVYAGGFGLWRCYVRVQEDGLVGLYSLDHALLGWMVGGEDERDGLLVTALWLAVLCGVTVAALSIRHPDALKNFW